MTQESCPIHGHEGAERIERRIPRFLRRPVLLAVGWISVVLGVIGMVVPLWPTTCFLLLAAWCFSRSSERMHRWLHENRVFGAYLRQYRDHRVISPHVRVGSLALMWGSILTSLVVIDAAGWLWALLLVVGGAVTVHLVSLRTAPGATPGS